MFYVPIFSSKLILVLVVLNRSILFLYNKKKSGFSPYALKTKWPNRDQIHLFFKIYGPWSEIIGTKIKFDFFFNSFGKYRKKTYLPFLTLLAKTSSHRY